MTRTLSLAAAVLIAGTAAAEENGFVSMFDGKTLKGWKKAEENPDSWKVEDGALLCKGPRCHLFYVGQDKPFNNFVFTCEVKTMLMANSGIYFHTKYQPKGWPKQGYEAQVNNTHRDPKKTGSVYAVKNYMKAPAKDGEWFTYTITVKGKTITTAVNGETLVEYTEPADKKEGKAFGRKLVGGTFALQAHDPGSVVYFRKLRVKRLPD